MNNSKKITIIVLLTLLVGTILWFAFNPTAIDVCKIMNISATQNGTLIYNGTEQTPKLDLVAKTAHNEDAIFTYSKTEDGEFTTTIPTYIDAGKYNLYYKVNAPNHKESDVKICEITVENAQFKSCSLDFENATIADVMAINSYASTWGNEEIVITFSKEENGVYSQYIPAFTDYGVHKLYYKISAQNHETIYGFVNVLVGEETLNIPTNLIWNQGVASWDSVLNATAYVVQLYKGNEIVNSFSTTNTSFDLENAIKSDASNDWKFKVMATNESSNLLSDYSEFSSSIKTYSILFDANGGIDSPSTLFAMEGEAITIPNETAVRSNCNFAGWATVANETTASVQPNDSIIVNSNITYYAVWTITLTIVSNNQQNVWHSLENETSTNSSRQFQNAGEISTIILPYGTTYYVYAKLQGYQNSRKYAKVTFANVLLNGNATNYDAKTNNIATSTSRRDYNRTYILNLTSNTTLELNFEEHMYYGPNEIKNF